LGLYVRGNRYYFKKQLEGKVYYKALKLKKGQEKLLSARLEQIEEEILAGHFGIPYQQNKQISFIDYAEKYLKSKKYKKSWDRDKQRLFIISGCLGDPLLSFVGKSHIEKLEKFLFARNLKPSTVNRYFEILNNLFRSAIEEKYISENPSKFYQKFVEDGHMRALSKEELKIILSTAKRLQEKPKSYIQSIIYDLIVLALHTGMRLSEIINLKKSYIRDDVIFYPISKTKHKRRVYSQNSKVKVICLNEIASAIVKRAKSRDDYVFSVKWRNPNVVYHVVRKLRSLSGIQDFKFHYLRHTTSTIVASQESLATAKMILYHADLKTTLRYTHPGIEEQKKGVAKIGEYFKDLQGNK